MTKISYAGYRFPPVIIQQAVWLYARFTLSFPRCRDLLAERGIMVSYETVRRWVKHFGSMIAADLRRRRPKPHSTWHLDEVFIKIDGRLVYLWRAVDAEGEVLDVLVQSKRDKRSALKLMRKLLKKMRFVPDKLVTDDLRSYRAAARDLGISHRHERGRWRNNRAENSHQPGGYKVCRLVQTGDEGRVRAHQVPHPPPRERRRPNFVPSFLSCQFRASLRDAQRQVHQCKRLQWQRNVDRGQPCLVGSAPTGQSALR
jgi:putative transposase